MKEKLKHFQINKNREFIARKPVPQKYQRGVLKAEMERHYTVTQIYTKK